MRIASRARPIQTALKQFLVSVFEPADLGYFARINRVERVMQPFLEAVTQ